MENKEWLQIEKVYMSSTDKKQFESLQHMDDMKRIWCGTNYISGIDPYTDDNIMDITLTRGGITIKRDKVDMDNEEDIKRFNLSQDEIIIVKK